MNVGTMVLHAFRMIGGHIRFAEVELERAGGDDVSVLPSEDTSLISLEAYCIPRGCDRRRNSSCCPCILLLCPFCCCSSHCARNRSKRISLRNFFPFLKHLTLHTPHASTNIPMNVTNTIANTNFPGVWSVHDGWNRLRHGGGGPWDGGKSAEWNPSMYIALPCDMPCMLLWEE